MKAFYFSESQHALLVELMVERSIMLTVEIAGKDADVTKLSRALFLDTCAILLELHKPDERLPPLGAHLDINDELPPIILPEYDPRARNPRCVHGVPFKDENGNEVPCERCEANWTDERLKRVDPIHLGEQAFNEAQVLSGANRVDPDE